MFRTILKGPSSRKVENHSCRVCWWLYSKPMQIWMSYPFCASSPESVCMHTWVEAWGDASSLYLGPELRNEGGEQNDSDLLRNCPCC